MATVQATLTLDTIAASPDAQRVAIAGGLSDTNWVEIWQGSRIVVKRTAIAMKGAWTVTLPVPGAGSYEARFFSAAVGGSPIIRQAFVVAAPTAPAPPVTAPNLTDGQTVSISDGASIGATVIDLAYTGGVPTSVSINPATDPTGRFSVAMVGSAIRVAVAGTLNHTTGPSYSLGINGSNGGGSDTTTLGVTVTAAGSPGELWTETWTGTGAASGTIYMVGLFFAQGDMPNANGLFRLVSDNSDLRTQINVKTTWGDGSIKFAEAFVELPLFTNGVDYAVKFVAGVTHASPGSNLTIDSTSLSSRSASITFTPNSGSAQTIDIKAAAIAASGPGDWNIGPLGRQVRVTSQITATAMGASPTYNSTGGRHVTDVTLLKNGDLFLDPQPRNDGWDNTSGLKTANFAFKMTIDGTDVLSTATKTMPPYCGAARIFGRKSGGGAADYWPVFRKPPASYLWSAKALPLYDTALGISSGLETTFSTARADAKWNTWLGRVSDGDPLYINNLINGGPTGPNENLYGIPFGNPGAAWMTAGGKHAQQYAMDQCEAMHGTECFAWDTANSDWVNLVDRPSTWLASTTPAFNSGSALFKADRAHTPQVMVAPYLLRGRRSCLDVLQGWLACQLSTIYRPGNPVWSEQLRAGAYTLSNLRFAAALVPPSEQPGSTTYWNDYIDLTLQWLLDQRSGWAAQEGDAYGYYPVNVDGVTAPADTLAYDIQQYQLPLMLATLSGLSLLGYSKATTFLDWMNNYCAGGFGWSGGYYPVAHFAYRIGTGPLADYSSVAPSYTSRALLIANNPTHTVGLDDDNALNGGLRSYPRAASEVDSDFFRIWGVGMTMAKVARPADSVVGAALTYIRSLDGSVSHTADTDYQDNPKWSIIPDAASTRL